MKITLSNVRSTFLNPKDPNPVNWGFMEMLSAAEALGIELEVCSAYMFKDSFNARISEADKERICEAIDDLPRTEQTEKEKYKQFTRDSATLHIRLGITDKIINDIRHRFMRCNYTGNLISLQETKDYKHKGYLEKINYSPESMRLWRLKDAHTGETLTVNDETIYEMAGVVKPTDRMSTLYLDPIWQGQLPERYALTD